MTDISKRVMQAGGVLMALGLIGFMGLIWLMIYGNLSGNLGFATGTQGYNDTQLVIGNLTAGYKTFFGLSPTFFIVAGVILLISMFVGLLAVVIGIYKQWAGNNKGGFN